MSSRPIRTSPRLVVASTSNLAVCGSSVLFILALPRLSAQLTNLSTQAPQPRRFFPLPYSLGRPAAAIASGVLRNFQSPFICQFVPYLDLLSLPQQKRTDDERNPSHYHRIPKSRVDVAGGGDC